MPTVVTTGTPDPVRAVVYGTDHTRPSGVARTDARQGEGPRLAALSSGLSSRYDELDRPPVRVAPSGSP